MNHRYLILFLLPLILFGCASQQNDTYGGIEGFVFNEDGTPLVNAKVAVKETVYNGRYPTNYSGAFKLLRVPTGTWSIEVHCPSSNYIGRHIDTKSITVEEGAVSHISFKVPNLYCYEPPYSEVSSIYTGYISHGFESSGFEPCNEDALKLSKNVPFRKASIWAGLSQKQSELLKENTLYFVKVKATLKGPGRFGHLGVSEYLLDVEKILYMQKVKKESCSRDTKNAS